MNKKGQVLIKKYSNRRLYDTSTSSYINLSDLCKLVKNNEDFKVVDAKTNKDLTRSVLVQIILDYETQGYELLPIDFLNHIIRFYDANSRDVATYFLEHSEKFFTKYQENIGFFKSNLCTNSGMTNMMEEINSLTQKNMDFFFKTMTGATESQAAEESECPTKKETV